jgi:hypothetical protein
MDMPFLDLTNMQPGDNPSSNHDANQVDNFSPKGLALNLTSLLEGPSGDINNQNMTGTDQFKRSRELLDEEVWFETGFYEQEYGPDVKRFKPDDASVVREMVLKLEELDGHMALNIFRKFHKGLVQEDSNESNTSSIRDFLKSNSEVFNWGASNVYGHQLCVTLAEVDIGLKQPAESVHFFDSDDEEDDQRKSNKLSLASGYETMKQYVNIRYDIPPCPPEDRRVLILDVDKTLIDFVSVSGNFIRQSLEKFISICRIADETTSPATCVIYRENRPDSKIKRGFEVPGRMNYWQSRLYLTKIEDNIRSSGCGVWMIKKRPFLRTFLMACKRRFHDMRIASQAGPEWLAAVVPFIDPAHEFFEPPTEENGYYADTAEFKNSTVFSFNKARRGSTEEPQPQIANASNPNLREKRLDAVIPDLIDPETKKFKEPLHVTVIDDNKDVWHYDDRWSVQHIQPCNFFDVHVTNCAFNNMTQSADSSARKPIAVDSDQHLLKWLDDHNNRYYPQQF